MPKFSIYTERKYSTVVAVYAETYEEALAKFDDYVPSDTDDSLDTAGEWEPMVIEQDGEPVWEAPAAGKIPVQVQKAINDATKDMHAKLREAGRLMSLAAGEMAKALTTVMGESKSRAADDMVRRRRDA